MGKLIDLTSRLKAVPPAEQAVLKQTTSEVLSYAEQKQKILFHERRQVKRTILTEIVSSMVVLPEKGLLKVDLYDISEEGISFDLPSDQGKFKIDEEVSIRVYLNNKTYFPMIAQVKHVTDEPLEGVSRHGAIFLKGAATDTATDAALQYFIRFIEIAGVGLRKDDGDLMAPKIS
jgi:hypothetical protein